ncbi:MAG: hypothetical protein V1725_07765 [archaeon]
MNSPTMQQSFIAKLEHIRKEAQSRFPTLERSEFDKILAQIAHHHYNRRGLLIGQARDVYKWLIDQGQNPFTVYRWTLLERVPEDIKFQVKQHKMSQKKAIREAFRRKHETFHELGASVREAGLALIVRM